MRAHNNCEWAIVPRTPESTPQMCPQPLAGLRIVNTRASRQAASLTRALKTAGAHVLHYPAIEILPSAESKSLDAALNALAAGRFDWLIVTSANTAYVMADRLSELGIALGNVAHSRTRVAAIGAATATAVEEELHLRVDFMPPQAIAESLAGSLPASKGDCVFLPQSALARPILLEALRMTGAEVTAVSAYHTAVGRGGDDLPQLFSQGAVDAITFTSASTVHNFLRRLQAELQRDCEDGGEERNAPAHSEIRPPSSLLPSLFSHAAVACIGPVTADAARSHHLPVHVVVENHTLEGLVQGIETYFAANRL